MSRVSSIACLVALLCADAPTASAQTHPPVWENRGQQEASGSLVELESGGRMVVATGSVGNDTESQWFVRGIDRHTGETAWEDRFGPLLFGLAKDVAVEGRRAFVAGWTLTPGRGFGFVVRAYDVGSGTVLWSQEVSLGPQCAIEAGTFARCVAKAVAVEDGRVFVVGHLTRTAALSDFAVLAFDARTGAQLWESVTDAAGSGSNDYAWAVAADGTRVFVLGEIADFSGLLLQAHEAKTGAILWQQRLPGAAIYTLKDTLAAGYGMVFFAATDAGVKLIVHAYNAKTGALRWSDRVEEGDRVGAASALVLQPESSAANGKDMQPETWERPTGENGSWEAGGKRLEPRLFVTGVINCDPVTFVDCDLALRAYDPHRGLVWQRADEARGGDWYATNIAVESGRVFVAANELLEDGVYRPTVRAYTTLGAFRWADLIDDGLGDGSFSGFSGFVNGLAARGNRLFVGGSIIRTDGTAEAIVRMYRAR